MKRTSISWSQRARQDLFEIGDFIARDKPQAASRWVARIIEAVERTALFSAAGRIVPEVDRDDVREILVNHYRVVYQLRGDKMIVLTVFEGHRMLVDSMIENDRAE